MATKTETYKLTKPARTDKVNIEDLNANFDIVEEELKKRALSSDVAGVAHYDLDLSSWVSVDFANQDGAKFTLTDYVDGGALLAAINAGRLPRVKFLCTDGTPHYVILGSRSVHDTDDGERTICSGTAANIYYDAYSNYSLNVVDNDGEYTIWFAAYPFLTGEGTVKSVNGVEPDEDGNVEISVAEEEASTTKLDFSNWADGSFTEYLDDGSTVVHAVDRDSDGKVTAIGGITIVGVS